MVVVCSCEPAPDLARCELGVNLIVDDCPPRMQYQVGGALVCRLDVECAASLPSGKAAHVLTPSTTFAIPARRFTLLRVA
jgi:hypothetical protein